MASPVAIMSVYKNHSYEFKLNKVHTYLYTYIHMKVTKLKEPKLPMKKVMWRTIYFMIQNDIVGELSGSYCYRALSWCL